MNSANSRSVTLRVMGLLLLLTLPTHLWAQTPSPLATVVPATVFESERVPEISQTAALGALNSSLARAPDHRYEGAAIGAVALGVGFALLVSAADSDSGSDPSPVLVGLGGAMLGGLLGLLIGGAIPKAP